VAGQELFEALVQNTGLPEDYVRIRFARLIEDKGISLDELNLDNVREVLSDLLLDLIHHSSDQSL
jgi:hypothetical protein